MPGFVRLLNWFHGLMPRDSRFFPLFERHAAVMVETARTMRTMLEGGEAVARRCSRIVSLEEEADAIARDVFIAVHSTFITPFDRGDIRDLITAMDDAVDQMQKTAKAIVLFEMTAFEPEMRDLADAIIACAELVARAMPLLRQTGRNANALTDIALRITEIEGEGDAVHERGLSTLYRRTRDSDAMGFIRGSEIYDHLEAVIDRCEDIADRIQGIVIEHV